MIFLQEKLINDAFFVWKIHRVWLFGMESLFWMIFPLENFIQIKDFIPHKISKGKDNLGLLFCMKSSSGMTFQYGKLILHDFSVWKAHPRWHFYTKSLFTINSPRKLHSAWLFYGTIPYWMTISFHMTFLKEFL